MAPSGPTEFILIEGGRPLSGAVPIEGAKNAALPCMAAALLTADDCVIENVPAIEDVQILAQVMRVLGATVEQVDPTTWRINAAAVHTVDAPPDLVRKMRASFLVMGPLLARFGRATSCAPGGDVIGQRPIDVHWVGFGAMGAALSREGEIYSAESPRLQGASIFMDYPSHIGTENLLMAATLADGVTTMINASGEPEVVCLAGMLEAMGARIAGAGSNRLVVEGVERLHGVTHRVIPDRIEAGTFAMAAAITRGSVVLEGARPDHMEAVIWKLREAQVDVDVRDDGFRVTARRPLAAVNVQALPYPGFPTDLQSAIGVLLTQARGESVIHERVYDNRLLYVHELTRMGAEIDVRGQTAVVYGPRRLKGTDVRALDIRSGASLVLGGLVATGETRISDVWHLDRGYAHFDDKIRSLGAAYRRVVQDPQPVPASP